MRSFVCFLLFSFLLSGCSTLKMGNTHYITLEACSQASCETNFLIHSSQDEWIEQLVFNSEVSLIDMGVLKNTRAGNRPFLGVGFNSDQPSLVLVPIGQKVVDGAPMKITIVHGAPHTIKLKLKYPKGISIEPTR